MTFTSTAISVATATATADVIHSTVNAIAIVAIKPVIGIRTLTPATVKQFLLI